MKITKGYAVTLNGICELAFDNESDRNEMALALYEESVYHLWMRYLNHYNENNIEEAIDLTNENLFTYDTMIVEG